MEKLYCPNCKQVIDYKLGKNRWVKWIDLNCDKCGYNKRLKEEELALIQPDSPLWELVYGAKPKQDKHVPNIERREEEREKNFWKKKKEGKLKQDDINFIKSYTKERGL